MSLALAVLALMEAELVPVVEEIVTAADLLGGDLDDEFSYLGDY